MEAILNALNTLDGMIWGRPLVFLLFGTGLYLTVGMRFMSIRRLPYAIGLLFSKNKDSDDKSAGEISPVAALFTALSATIGTGNIAGVATAITLGGPGAIFWMWMTAILGMATKYSEALLAVRFRETDENGQHVGGPMYYIKNGMGKNWVWLAWTFAICTAIAAPGTGNLVQANGVAALFNTNVPFPDVLQCQETLKEALAAGQSGVSGMCSFAYPEIAGGVLNTVGGEGKQLGIPLALSGLTMAVLVFFVIMGGVKSIARVASFLVPIMAVFYVVGALIVLGVNIEFVPAAFAEIFEGVVSPRAAAGGFLGATVMAAMAQGANRGSFSNEAGLGSAAIAHASARTNDPVRQGSIAMLGTFIDTLIVCTLTALVILTAPAIMAANGIEMPVWQSGIASAAGVTSAAFGQSIPGGQWIVTIGLAVFAFTTILGWALYGERAMEFMFGVKVIPYYRIFWCFVVYFGAVYTNDLAWTLASIGNGLMAGPNLIALLGLSGVVFAMTREDATKRNALKLSEAQSKT